MELKKKSVWMPYTFAAVIALLVAVLMGQAAYIRGRLDVLAPPDSLNGDAKRCSACYPAVRAYSLQVNVPATKGLADLTSNIIASNQYGRCGTDKTFGTINEGTFPANYLVVRGGAGGMNLLNDVLSGATRFVIIDENTYIITATNNGPAETKARQKLSGSNVLARTDIFFLIQTVSKFGSSFQSSTVSCKPVIAQSPITTKFDSPGGRFLTTIGTLSSDVFVHAWGYAGASESPPLRTSS